MHDTAASDLPRATAAILKRQWSHALFGYDVFISYTRLSADGTATPIIQDGSAQAVRLSSARAGGRFAMHAASSDTDIAQYSGLSRVLVKDGDTSKRPFIHRLTGEKVTALALDAKGERLAIATSAGLIRIVDSVSGNVPTEVSADKDIAAIAFDSSGEHLAVLSKAGRASVQLSQPPRPLPVAKADYGDPPLFRVRGFRAQGDVVIYTWSALVDDSLGLNIVLDRRTGRPLQSEPFYYSADFLDGAHRPEVVYTDILAGVAGVAGQREWLVNLNFGHLDWSRIGERRSPVEGQQIDPHESDGRREDSRRLEVSPDGRQLAVIRYSGPPDPSVLDHPTREDEGPWTLEIVDVKDPRIVKTMWTGNGYPSDLAWSSDGTRLAMALAAGGIRIWRRNDWALATAVPSGARTRLSFARDGTLAATWQFQPAMAMLAVIDSSSGRIATDVAIPTAGIDVVLTLSDSRVALGHRDGRVTIVDTTREDIRTAGAPGDSRVVRLEVSDDGKTLLVTRLRADDQPLCSLADAEFGHDLLELQINGAPARAAAFLSERRGVVMASDDQLYVWLARSPR